MITTARDDIVRANGRGDASKYSDQDRYSKTAKLDKFDFSSFLKIFRDTEKYNIPVRNKDNRARDEFLLKFVEGEPNLMGVISSVVEVDTNRGWRLVGGRNQVMRYTDILHNYQAAEGFFGWRPGMASASRSFWNTDMGMVVEVGRQGKKGPVRGFFAVDPTTIKLTGNNKYPIKYYGDEDTFHWTPEDYFRTASLPAVQQDLAGMGYCAASRAFELAVLMMAVYAHDKEMLGARAPTGLLLLQGISQTQWDDAMIIREAGLDAKERQYYGAVAILASKNLTLDAKLIALSQLPKGFNRREWVDLIMYGYALCFGYDASEFFPVQFGAIGRGTETEVQHEKATAKGRLAFALGFQEQLQYFLPDTLLFQFDVRDDKGDQIRAESQAAQVRVVTSMFESGLSFGMGLISRPQALALLANYDIIPSEWVPSDVEIQTDKEGGTEIDIDPDVAPGMDPALLETDPNAEPVVPENGNTPRTRHIRDALLSRIEVLRAAERYPREPIVQYTFPDHVFSLLAVSGEALLKKVIF